LQTSFQLVSN